VCTWRAWRAASRVGEEGEGDGAEDNERDAKWEEAIYGERYGRHRHEGEMAVVED
jgi:hypothetical protein